MIDGCALAPIWFRIEARKNRPHKCGDRQDRRCKVGDVHIVHVRVEAVRNDDGGRSADPQETVTSGKPPQRNNRHR